MSTAKKTNIQWTSWATLRWAITLEFMYEMLEIDRTVESIFDEEKLHFPKNENSIINEKISYKKDTLQN